MHIIKHATTEHAEIIAALHVASKQEGYKDLYSAEHLSALCVKDHADNWTKWLGSTTQVLIAYDAATDQPAGFIAFGPGRTRMKEDRGIVPKWPGEIYAFYVHPNAWGKGAAQDLLKASVKPLQKNYWDKTSLWVLEKNYRAIKFYEKMGAQRIGRQKVEMDGKKMVELAYGWKDISKIKLT